MTFYNHGLDSFHFGWIGWFGWFVVV